MQVVKEYCINGWPTAKENCNASAKIYYSLKDDLSVVDELIFKGNALIIPSTMRNSMLNQVHNGHQGLNRCLEQLRNIVYWPNMNTDLKNKIEQCEACLMYRKSNTKEPILWHDETSLPWQKVGMDLFNFQGSTYIIIVDYFSKYIEIALLNRTDSKSVIIQLRLIFARHGIPMEVVSDGGPPFNSAEFETFMRCWDIKHIFSSPYYPKSNGLAERSVKIVKDMLKKCQVDGSDPYMALLQLRTTPKGEFNSPS